MAEYKVEWYVCHSPTTGHFEIGLQELLNERAREGWALDFVQTIGPQDTPMLIFKK